jgi:hypothetical protein
MSTATIDVATAARADARRRPRRRHRPPSCAAPTLGPAPAHHADVRARCAGAVARSSRSSPTGSPGRAWSSSASRPRSRRRAATPPSPTRARQQRHRHRAGHPAARRHRGQRFLIWFNGLGRRARSWATARSGSIRTLVDRVIDDRVPSFMRVDVERRAPHRGRAARSVADAAYFEYFSLDEVNDTLRSVRLSLILGTVITTALGVLAGSVRRPPRGAPGRRRGAGGQGDRRRAARHPARAHRRPRPQRARELVQRHGQPRSRPGSSATPASRPTSATSCGRR